jgi:hypothetical protein
MLKLPGYSLVGLEEEEEEEDFFVFNDTIEGPRAPGNVSINLRELAHEP